MRVHRVFVSFAISIGCGIASQNVAFSQEYRGTAEQQMACTPDVWRLCGAQIPDVDRIVACLRRNTAQLSEPCRAVNEPTANSPRRRDDQPRLTIATMGRDLTIATMGQGLTTTNSAPPLPMIATRSVWNGVVVDHQRSRDGCWYLDTGTPSRNSCPTGSNAKERCSGSKCHNIKC